MGMIIDTNDALRIGLEARSESFTVYANEWEENRQKVFVASATIDGRVSSVSIEMEYDQLDHLIDGLIKLREYARRDGRIK